MKVKFLTIFALAVVMASCGGEKKEETTPVAEEATIEVVEEEVVVEEAAAEEATSEVDLSDKGVGPITELTLGDVDDALAEQGKEVYKTNCTACHKMGKRFVGPGLAGITQRRSPEWIMNMILNPEVMVVENAAAKKLLEEYNAPMANQSLSEEDARAILEFLRTKN